MTDAGGRDVAGGGGGWDGHASGATDPQKAA